MKIIKCEFEKGICGGWLLPAMGWSKIDGVKSLWFGWLFWMWTIEYK